MQVPLLNPTAYMESAGLTSKEYAHRVRRDPIEEKLEDTVRTSTRTSALEPLHSHLCTRTSALEPLHSHPGLAPLHSNLCTRTSALVRPHLRLLAAVPRPPELPTTPCQQSKIVSDAYVGTKADDVMYGRSVGGDSKSAKSSISDMPVKGYTQKFDGRAGLHSAKMFSTGEERLVLELEKTIVWRTTLSIYGIHPGLPHNPSTPSGSTPHHSSSSTPHHPCSTLHRPSPRVHCVTVYSFDTESPLGFLFGSLPGPLTDAFLADASLAG